MTEDHEQIDRMALVKEAGALFESVALLCESLLIRDADLTKPTTRQELEFVVSLAEQATGTLKSAVAE